MYVKDMDDPMVGLDAPDNEHPPPEQTGGKFISNPFEFALTFYLAAQYPVIPSLRSLANLISTVSQVCYRVSTFLTDAPLASTCSK